MSKFYGQVQGSHSVTTRTGSKYIRASTQSWDGSVSCELSYDSENNLNVCLECAEGSKFYGSKILYNGTFENLKKAFDLLQDIKSGKCSVVRHRQIKTSK